VAWLAAMFEGCRLQEIGRAPDAPRRVPLVGLSRRSPARGESVTRATVGRSPTERSTSVRRQSPDYTAGAGTSIADFVPEKIYRAAGGGLLMTFTVAPRHQQEFLEIWTMVASNARRDPTCLRFDILAAPRHGELLTILTLWTDRQRLDSFMRRTGLLWLDRPCGHLTRMTHCIVLDAIPAREGPAATRPSAKSAGHGPVQVHRNDS